MRHNFLALMLLGVMIGVNSDGAAGERKAAAKCRKPNGKLGQTKTNGCGTNVCKKSGGGGAVWESCPLPASGETVQEEIKSLRTLLMENGEDTRKNQELLNENQKETKKNQELLNENQKETKKNQELLNENQKETGKNQELLLEVLKRIGPLPQTMVPLSSVVFELKEEFNIEKNFLMGDLPYLGKQYKITFEWFITGFGSGYQNIIHFTTGNDASVYGDRTPGVWLYDDNVIAVWSAIEPTGSKRSQFAAKTGTWMTMDISQHMIADNKFEFDFKVDGTSYWTVENTKAEAFADVKMFSGDNWWPPLDGKIRNFQVQTKND